MYLSLPAVLGRDGVRDVLMLPLDAAEVAKLRASAAAIAAVQKELNLNDISPMHTAPAPAPAAAALGSTTTQVAAK